MAKLKIDSSEKIFNIKKIASAVYKTLNQTAKIKAEIVFVDANEIQRLNRETRKVDRVTDVLSYPSLDGIRGVVLKREDYTTSLDGKYIFIGSIALCKDKIQEQAIEYGHDYNREQTYLIVHGLMHLFGFDHIDETDKKQMREKEKLALKKLGIEQ